MKMKKIVSVILLVSIMAGIYACKKDKDKAKPTQPPQVEDFILKGTVQTDQAISPENTVEVYIARTFMSRKNDKTFLAAIGKISDNKFSIPIKNPEDSLNFIIIDSVVQDIEQAGGHIIKLKCNKEKIKLGAIAGVVIKNSGTGIFGFENAMLSTGEVAIYGDENAYIPHMIFYYYSSEDFILHTDRFVVGKNDVKATCNFKKGWNLVKWDTFVEAGGVQQYF